MKKIEVVAAVIERGGKYFATQRGYGEYKDWWEFPGGKVERGETLEEALTREIREELDTEIGVERFLCTVEADYATFHLILHAFVCSVVKGRLTLLEAEDSRWLDRESLHSVNWLPADSEIVDRLLGGGKGQGRAAGARC